MPKFQSDYDYPPPPWIFKPSLGPVCSGNMGGQVFESQILELIDTLSLIKFNIFLWVPYFLIYRTRAILTRSRFETALVYKPRILGLKNEEYPFLVHNLSVI